MVNASSTGAGGIWLLPFLPPIVFCIAWPLDIVNRYRAKGLTNSDLEMAGIFMAWFVLEELVTLFRMASELFTDNSPSASWTRRLISNSVHKTSARLIHDKKYVKDTILCGSSTIKRVALIVKRFADSFIPYHISSLAPEHGKGEVISFDLGKVLPVVLRATNIYEAAKEQHVEIPQSSSDATIISKNMSFIIYGIKIKDRAAVCPITKHPLDLPADNGQSAKTLVQSYENCIPVKIIKGKETKEVVSTSSRRKMA
jgi:hypothetical protein